MQLIKVSRNSYGEQVVDAKDLYIFLNIQKDFLIWIKEKIKKYGFIESEDYTIDNNRYLLTLDTAKEITMVEDTPSGRPLRKYFIQCEKKYNGKKAIEYILHQNAAVRHYTISIISLINQAEIRGEIKGNQLKELLNTCSRLKAHAFPYSTDIKYKVSDNRIRY